MSMRGQPVKAGEKEHVRKGQARKKPWQRKGGHPRLKSDNSGSKKGRANLEQALKVLRGLQLQAIKDLRQALRNARQFEVRKVCRRQRVQEDKCKEVAATDSAAAAPLQKGLAKLAVQLEALKAISVSAVLPHAVAQAGLPAKLLQGSRDEEEPAADAQPKGWAVDRLLAAHCVQQACNKVKQEQTKQKQAIEMIRRRKEKKEAGRQADGGEGQVGQQQGHGLEPGCQEDAGGGQLPRLPTGAKGESAELAAEGSGMSAEEDEGVEREASQRALAKLQQMAGQRRARTDDNEGDRGALSSEGDSQSDDDLEDLVDGGLSQGLSGAAVSVERGGTGLYEDVSVSGSDAEEEPDVTSRTRAAEGRRSKAGPAKAGGKVVKKSKNRLGQRERRRLATAAMPRGIRPTPQGPYMRSTNAKQGKRMEFASRLGRGAGTQYQHDSGNAAGGRQPPKRAPSKAPPQVELHPSWAARKVQAGAVRAFSGKKVVFDEEGQANTPLASPSIGGKSSEKKIGGVDGKSMADLGSLHPSWAAKRSQAQKLSLSAASVTVNKIKFDD